MMTEQISIDEQRRCYSCFYGMLTRVVKDEEFEFDLGHKVIQVVAKDLTIIECSHCVDDFMPAESVIIKHNAIMAAAGYLSYTEYVKIRLDKELETDELAMLIGCDTRVVVETEIGRRLPHLGYDLIMRFIQQSPTMK